METSAHNILYFAAILLHLQNCFFTPFRHFLAGVLEEPVKVLKVGWNISACSVSCGEAHWNKATLEW